jgi:hypothetical protein
VIALVEGVFANLAGDLPLTSLSELGILSGKAWLIDEFYTEDQTRPRQGLLIDVEQGALGRITLLGPHPRFRSQDDDHQTRAQRVGPAIAVSDTPPVLV